MTEQDEAVVRVLLIDDSELDARYLARALSRDARLRIVGHAHDAWEARALIKALDPDVVTLDLGLPGMSGLTFLANLMRLRPMPVVVVSGTIVEHGSVTLDALEAGAVDVLSKDRPVGRVASASYAADVAARVRAAASVPVRRRSSPESGGDAPGDDVAAALLERGRERLATGRRLDGATSRLICIGASTGGPDAIRRLMASLRPDGVAVAVAQHMASPFVEPYAARLDRLSGFDVVVAEDGLAVRPGHAYVAPGDRHLSFVRDGSGLRCRVDAGAKLHGHRPSVDRLFASAADVVGDAAVGVLLTGMGGDGAAGLKELHARGALTVAQDRESSAVWGMPGRAVASGAVDLEVPIHALAPLLNAALAA